MDRSGGILRKKSSYHQVQNFDDLIVIGYASKIFRNDEKANFIDQQRHLIPWRDSADGPKIDRYDVRGHCDDLTPFEAPVGGYGTRIDYLTPAEQRAETLCEEERYYSLLKNEVEEEMYREEQFKRLANSYNEIGFSYEGYGEIGPEPAKPPEPAEETDNVPFALPPSLKIPPEIELPANMKEHAIIEKTAKFIASQGLQMEILMKAKQANNAQFDFLNIGGKCNAYYKHILEMIKNNTYVSFDQEESKNDETSNDSSLDIKKPEEEISAIIVPQIRYKPSADCAYTQLISKITGATITSIEAASQSPQNGNSTSADPTTKLPNGLLGLVSYNSDTDTDHESEPEEETFTGELPPDYLQTIIDKTALYVAKNGTDFEEILRIKQDPRFTFLDLENEYHPYYLNKVRLSRIEIGPEASEKVHKKPEEVKKVQEAPKTKVILPVSFSIKPKDDNQVPLKPTILPQEPDSDEEKSTPASNKPIAAEIPTMNNDSYIEELERQIESINDFNQKKEERKNEEKIKDKLANAAREKLNMVSKEKLLQIERRKKAMAFLQIKGVTPSTTNGNSKQEESQVIELNDDKIVTIVDDSDDSVHSIPIPDRLKSHSKSRKRSSSVDSRSSSRRKKSKRSHSKKKSKRRSHTRSRSRSSDRKYHKSSKSRRDARERSRDSRDRRDRRH